MDKQMPDIPTLINLSEAARLLGYQSTEPIKKLIKDKNLHPYQLPDTRRIMVDRKELESLLKIFIPQGNKNKEK